MFSGRFPFFVVFACLVGLGCAGVSQKPAGQDGGSGSGGRGSTDGPPTALDGIVIPTANCGNGALDPGEQCDDGAKLGGDGCTAICQTEDGWTCPNAGAACTMTVMCGDGRLQGAEVCDDGNTTGGDGCAANCLALDPGYECRVPGRRCVPACGDGRLVGGEKCDDGNSTADDGCSPTCLVEPGASCTGTPSRCTVAVCGDGTVVANVEACDCGNGTGALPAGCLGPNGLFTGDPMEARRGCSKTCTKEPACRGGTMGAGTRACDTSCGNGNVEMGEGCDDGNRDNGDGCSMDCAVEAGFTCMDQMRPDTETCAAGTCLRLPVVYRDFKSEKETGGHPDFFYLGATISPAAAVTSTSHPTVTSVSKRVCVSNSGGPAKQNDSTVRCWDLAQANLGANGKPAFNMARAGGLMCDCQFTDWSHNGNRDTQTGVLHVPGYASGSDPPNPLSGVPYMGAPGNPLGAPYYRGTMPIVKSADSFAQWWLDSNATGGFAGVTRTVGTLELAGAGPYQFASLGHAVFGGFFPIDPPGQFPVGGSMLGPGTVRMVGTEPMLCNLWPYWHAPFATAGCRGDQYLFPPSITMPLGGMWGSNLQGWFHNFWYTTEARYLFTYDGNPIQLSFYGDDDLFIFINGVLVLDLGGVHQRLPGQVTVSGSPGNAMVIEGGSVNPTTNLITPCPGVDPITMQTTNATCAGGTCDCRTRPVTLGLMAGRTYEIAVFHADRHPTESNYQLTLSGFATKRTNCMPSCGDGVTTGAEECDCGATTPSADPSCGGMMNNNTTYGGCTMMCKFGPYCGDGMLQADQEECDLGSRMNTGGYGQQGCTPGCRKPHFCGDTIVDSNQGEQCDLGSNNGTMGACCTMDCKVNVDC
jgi:cysteine-rich repeat protein